jgi:hypothetical protein
MSTRLVLYQWFKKYEKKGACGAARRVHVALSFSLSLTPILIKPLPQVIKGYVFIELLNFNTLDLGKFPPSLISIKHQSV